MRRALTAVLWALAALTVIQPAHAQTARPYVESDSTAGADATYFYRWRGRDEHEKHVILVFNSADSRLNGATALLVTQSIDCATGRITTVRYAAYGDDGAILSESRAVPDSIASTIGVEIWAEQLRSSCEPPTTQPIPVAIDPPPMPDRDFRWRISDAPEAIALLRARADARVQGAALAGDGRWGTFTRDGSGSGAFIDYARSDATHMSYLAYAGPYERAWSYARARYAVDCAAQTAFVEYFVTYNYADEIVDVSGPTQQKPFAHMSAQRALTAFCASPAPTGRTYDTVQEALTQIRRETTRR